MLMRKEWWAAGFVLCVLVLLAVANVYRGRPPETTVRVGTSSYSTATTLVVSYGLEKGIFEKHGVNVSLLPLRDIYSSMLAFSSGQVDVVFHGLGIAAASLEQGASFKIAMSLKEATDLMLVSMPPHAQVEDLKGRRIGLVGRNSDSYRILSWYLESRGMDLDRDFEVVEVKNPGAMATGLVSGDLDAVVLWGAYASRLLRNGAVQLLGLSEAVKDLTGHPLQIPVLLVSESFLEDRRTANRFISAFAEACKEVVENKDEAAQIWARFSGLDPSELRPLLDIYEIVGDMNSQIESDIKAFFDYASRRGALDPVPSDIFYDEWKQ